MVEKAKERVAVIGGGVSGLSVAHELAKRDFAVTVFERRSELGGKAASSEYEESGLPSEHGFRFFPGFYFHVVDTMKDIPAADGSGSVADHLVDLDTAIFARRGRRMTMPLPTSERRPLLREQIRAVWSFRESMPGPWECACFLAILARLTNTCEQRWDVQLEDQSWLEHVMTNWRGRPRSEKFKQVFAIGLTRSFVATRAEEMNARTGGTILLQLLYDSFFGPPIRRAPDRALDGPTTTVWIDPWHDHLVKQGVEFRQECEVKGLDIPDGGDQIGALWLERVEGDAGEVEAPSCVGEQFDWYVLAVPCEVLKQMLVNSPRLRDLDPDLRGVFNLKTQWMNGIVLGLTGELDPPLPKGHVLCLDSEWAVTLLDQSKVWSDRHLVDIRKRWNTLLSVDISDWDSPGCDGLPAKWPPKREDLVKDLWQQLNDHLPELKSQPQPRHFNLDFEIQYQRTNSTAGGPFPIGPQRTNDEPLLINTPGSWSSRPEAKTVVPNLFVAGDFPRTYTNFASMEAANEAARRAVNELLKSAGRDDKCGIEPLQDPDVWWFKAPQRIAQRVDEVIFRLKLPLRPPFRLPIAAWIVLGLTAKLTGLGRRPPPPAD